MPAPADPSPAQSDPATAEPAEPAGPAGPAGPAEPAELAELAEPAGPAQNAGPTEPAEPAGTAQRRRRWQRRLTEAVITLTVAALLAVSMREFGYETFWIPSASMVPALAVNDRILVQKAFFNPGDVREGDIVVFTQPPSEHCGPPGDLVKRVIALPGQTIYSSDGRIYVNGNLLAEPYLPADDPLGPPVASSRHPFHVPPGEFYVMGDNRADSCDSRFWGPIQGSSIIGKAVLIIWHNGRPDFHGL